MENGTRLGPYQILDQLGAGGMGEVYLAEDTRLHRKVAIKVLPAEFAADPERVARFEQEARAAAALNHPHIAAVFDIGEHDARVRYIVQEYLKGHSLRHVLEAGALPLKRALRLGTEIAEALVAAHAAGIIHRDIKPDNVFVTPDGHAKVLDFGLAKLTEATGASLGGQSMSPTVLGTQAGAIMGTAGYMAPEQVEGREVDARADLFAFGCVLYEMTSGKKPFRGQNVYETLGRIVSNDPEPLQADSAPPELQRILRKCLAKDPAERAQSAGDLVVDLRLLASDVESGTAAAAGERDTDGVPGGQPLGAPGGSRPMVWAGAAALLVVGFAASSLWTGRTLPETSRPATRLTLPLDPGLSLGTNVAQVPFALSPDGRTLVYAPDSVSEPLYRRDLDSREAQPLAGTEGASSVFFSPDGRWVGFHSVVESALMRVSLSGGAPQRIASIAGQPRGVSWGADDTIVFSGNSTGGLRSVPASGGLPDQLTHADAGGDAFLGHTYPHHLPDGDHVLFTISAGEMEGMRIAVLSLSTGEVTELGVRGQSPWYSQSGSAGYLVYGQSSGLVAVPFDLASLTVTGVPVALFSPLHVQPPGSVFVAHSADGMLVYAPLLGIGVTEATWVDRRGGATPFGRGFDGVRVRLSPDGSRIAGVIESAGRLDLWIGSLQTDERYRLTTAGNANLYPAWSPDGRRLAYSSDRTARFQLHVSDAGGGGDERLVESEFADIVGSWSPDGSTLFFYRVDPVSRRDLYTYSFDDGAVTKLLATDADERSPMISPDGRWLAYLSDESGIHEVYVVSYPDLRTKRRVSEGGAAEPRWSAAGDEIFYRSDDRMMMAAAFVATPQLEVGAGRVLFEDGYARDTFKSASYAISPDGRFLMGRVVTEPTIDSLNVVQGFREELHRVVSAQQ